MNLIDFILHIDDHLVTLVNTFGNWSYLILFAIIFIETGVVIFPFLPGDSLVFAACAMAASPKSSLNSGLCYFLFLIAAVLGDSSNYEIGHWSESKSSDHNWFNKLINQEHRKAAENFFDSHGGVTILLGRFIPFIRTFVPFVAGASKMHYRTFIFYNILGALCWVSLFSILGYFFGNISIVQEHFSLIVIGIIVISVLPPLIMWLQKKITLKKELR